MKTITFLFLLVAASVFGASPSWQQFSPLDFRTNGNVVSMSAANSNRLAGSVTNGQTAPVAFGGAVNSGNTLSLFSLAGTYPIGINNGGYYWFDRDTSTGLRKDVGSQSPQFTGINILANTEVGDKEVARITGGYWSWRTNAVAAWPTVAHSAGGMAFINSNGTWYQFDSGPGSTSFTSTNYIVSEVEPFVSILTNDFVIGTRYTNTVSGGFITRRATVSASFGLTGAAAGTAQVSLWVETLGVRTNKVTASAGPLASLAITEALIARVGPGAVWFFANEDSGVGSSSVIVTLTSSYVAD